MIKPKQIRASWNWINPWSDDTENVRYLARELQWQGVRAATLDSIYVGHRTLAVHPEDVKKATKALRLLGEDVIARSFERAKRNG